MLISVIVPVYKVEPYLRKCVDSILAQTFRDFELILVDDGSPDNCGKMCDEYAAKDARIKVIHQQNGGLSAARNAGIDYAVANSNSEYITFIDSDDWVAPDCLEMLLHGMDMGVDVSCASCCYVFNDRAKCRRCAGDGWKVGTAEEYWMDSLSLGQIACAKLYRKELFSDVRFPVGRLHEDVHTTHRLLFKRGRVAYTNLPLYLYRMRKGSIIHQESVTRCKDAVEGLASQVDFFAGICNERLKSVALCRKLALMISLLPFLNKQDPKLADEYRNVISWQSSEVNSAFWDGREYYRLVQPRFLFVFRWGCHVLWDLATRGTNSWIVKGFPSVLRLSRMERREAVQYE